MSRYQIIDEPQSKSWAENFIVDPTLILFAALLLPIVWHPPGLMRYWLPMLWLVFNGYALGSKTLKSEIGILAAGATVWFLTGIATVKFIEAEAFGLQLDDVAPYVRIIQFAIFFFTLYLVVFRQGASHTLYAYLKDGQT